VRLAVDVWDRLGCEVVVGFGCGSVVSSLLGSSFTLLN
jgi:hypothetical protein